MTLEQQFQQMTESANKMPGELNRMAYISFAIGLIILILGARKSLKYFKLDESEKHYTGWGCWFYAIALIVMSFGYFFQSMGNIAAMVK